MLKEAIASLKALSMSVRQIAHARKSDPLSQEAIPSPKEGPDSRTQSYA
ncbi:hypothetical protein HW132_08370 [Brasilonema sp. CT11]|nr:hypothetical protein [Brasilonema sp. CT11]